MTQKTRRVTMKKLAAWALAPAWMAALAVPAPAKAQAPEWPSKSIRLIVPFPPGGSVDVLARALAVRMAKRLGKSVTIENISGGATIPAVQSLLRSEADGHTMLITSDVTLSVNPVLLPSAPYSPARDMNPITIFYKTANWLIVKSDRPEKSFSDLVKTIAANPGQVTIGVNAVWGSAQLGLETWKKTSGLDFTVVPYRGGPAAITDLIGGQVTATVDVPGSSMPHVRSGKVRPLGVLQNKRSPSMKDVPAVLENGGQGPQVQTFVAIVAKSGTPADRIQKLNTVIRESAQEPEYQALLASLVSDPVLSSPAEAAAYIESETVRYGKLVKESGVKLE
ncbi:Bug family tripartite tricarboxylate transporter substrate binding protein [Klebsiella variicola]|uniref:Bug family tripartite tricarboxylate transporter substrate binding protein n=1 Tax=Pseudomonas aeruginosa TaxID=287 RepID=UPI00106A4CD2|nr:tripartite tricarboxylate transporter substrate binding protein [Pseudomonas aeruginosa]